jgi:small subunit ribosomal protein S3
MWALNTIMSQGALGVEVTISGKLRTERAHFEKHTVGVVPKSGDIAGKMVTTGISHVLTKMGLMGIQLRIASKAELPQEFQLTEGSAPAAVATEPAKAEEAPAAEAKTEAAPAEAGVEQSGQA